jgi:hypothetical protein
MGSLTMSDMPDTGGWLRYPSMQPTAETEAPADPKDANRYPSMPGGRVADRRVPRYPAADESAGDMAEPDLPDAEAARLRARYPSMFEDEPEAAAPADEDQDEDEAEPTEDPDAEESGEAASLPAAYRDLPAPEGLEVDTAALAAVAPDLQRLGVSRRQAAGLVGVLAKLESEADKHLDKVAADWRAEAERLPPAEVTAARDALKGAPPELHRVLEASRLGNHGPTIKWLASLRAGDSAPVADRLARRYPSMPQGKAW